MLELTPVSKKKKTSRIINTFSNETLSLVYETNKRTDPLSIDINLKNKTMLIRILKNNQKNDN